MKAQIPNAPAWPVSSLIMVRPAQFGFNAENTDNAFAQSPADLAQSSGQDASQDAVPHRVHTMALQEFHSVCVQLEQLGLELQVFDDLSQSPDAVFPNNWCSLHAEGQLFLYPMKSPLRRSEVRPDFAQELKARGFNIGKIYDWSGRAEKKQFLEGTGSLVLDSLHRVAYMARSERSQIELAKLFCAEMGYELLAFHSLLPPTLASRSAQPAYHTNVLMGIGLGFVLWCPEAMPLLEDRERLQARFARHKQTAIALNLAQIQAFAGNMLQVQPPQGPCLLMSQSAYLSLSAAQIEQLKTFTQLHAFAIPTIEKVGGGSLRCMLLENPLNKFI